MATLVGGGAPSSLAQAVPIMSPPQLYRTIDTGTTQPRGIDVGDFYDQGLHAEWLDVAVANADTNSVTLFRNKRVWYSCETGPAPDTGLERMISIDVGGPAYDVAIGDIDNNAHEDIVVAVQNLFDPRIVVIYNNDGQFNLAGNPSSYTIQSRVLAPNMHWVNGIAIDELNMNNFKDIAVSGFKYISTNNPRAHAHLMLQTGASSYVQQTFQLASSEEFIFDALDTNIATLRTPAPAGKDVALVLDDGSVAVLLNNSVNGDGTVNWTQYKYGTPVICQALTVNKFRKGNKPNDVFLPESTEGQCQIMWNANTWTGAAADLVLQGDLYPTAPFRSAQGVDSGFINRDLNNDVVVACPFGPSPPYDGVAVFAGKTDGTFVTPCYAFATDTAQDPETKFVVLGDMNRDTVQDVVTSNGNTSNVAVLINCTPPLMPILP